MPLQPHFFWTTWLSRSLFLAGSLALLYPATASSQTLAEAGWFSEAITPQPEVIPLISPRFSGQFTTHSGLDNHRNYGSIYGWFPFSTTVIQDLGFTETRLHFDTEKGYFSSNFLLGYRQLTPDNQAVFGTYLSYDFRNTGTHNFQQISGGLEWLNPAWEIRLNGYVPFGNRRSLVSEQFITLQNTFSRPRFQNRFLVVNQQEVIQHNRQFEAALTGFDFEVGNALLQGSNGDLWGYVGMYFYGGEGTESFGGWRSRLLAQYNNRFNGSLTLQSDGKFGTNLILSFGMSWGGYAANNREAPLLQQFTKPIVRQDRIAVETQLESEIIWRDRVIFMTNPVTQQPWRFFHVLPGGNNGNGTIESPFNSIIAATAQTQGDRNEIIYVQTGNNSSLAGFTIPDFVQVLSTGPQQFINTVELGQLQLLNSGNNRFPIVQNTVNMGNNTVLSGFAITGQNNPGVVIQNAGNVEVRDNIIQSQFQAGIQIENTTGSIHLQNNQITGNTVPALVANNVENVSITGSQLNSFNSLNNGITLNQIRGNFNLENTAFNIARPADYGIQVSQVTGNVNLTATTGSQIRNSGLAGASLTDNTSFSGFIIDAAGNDGIIANNSGNLTIANNQITNGNNGINIRDNTDAIAINQNQITNVTNGINLQDINAAVTIAGNQIEANNNGIAVQNLNDAIAIDNNRISNVTNGIDIQGIAGTAAIANNEITNMVNNGVNIGILDNLAHLTINNNQIRQAGADGRGISIDEMQNNAQVTVNINNNHISNIGDEGIYFNDIQNNARANITIDRNLIEFTRQEGIQVDFIENFAIANVTISGNTIRDTGADQEGIYFDDIQGDAIANITLSGNIIERVGSRAIAFDLIEKNATPTITIENNQIDTTGDQGIYFDDIKDFVITNIAISGNTIANTGADNIQLNNIQDDAIATLQIINNTLSNSAQNGLAIKQSSNNDLCLVLSGNTATGITGNGFNLMVELWSQFQIVDITNIAINNTGTFNPNNIPINPLFANGNLGTLPCP